MFADVGDAPPAARGRGDSTADSTGDSTADSSADQSAVSPITLLAPDSVPFAGQANLAMMPGVTPGANYVPRDRRLIMAAMDVGLTPRDTARFKRSKVPTPEERLAQIQDMMRFLDPDMVVMFGVSDSAWAGELAEHLLPSFPNIAYRASGGGGGPGGGIAVLSRHRFVDTRFHPLEPVLPRHHRGPDPGILLTTQDAGALGRVRLAIMETGTIPRRAADEPKATRRLRQQIQEIVSTVMDPDIPYPTLLLGTPPIWPERERAAWSALLSAGMVDGLMAAEPPVAQGIYDPHVGGLPAEQRHHLFMRVGDFAHMFLDRIETLEGSSVISMENGAWAHLPRHRPLRVTLTPRTR